MERSARDGKFTSRVFLYGDRRRYGRAAAHLAPIPIVFAGAGLTSKDLHSEVRSVDIMPTILETMGIAPTYEMDGRAYDLPRGRH